MEKKNNLGEIIKRLEESLALLKEIQSNSNQESTQDDSQPENPPPPKPKQP